MKRKYHVFRKIGKGKVNFMAKRNKKIPVLREIGKVAVNLSYLTFASLVLGSIIKGDYERLSIIWIGGGVTVLLITFGIIMLTAGGE
jgi:hypothetical protein